MLTIHKFPIKSTNNISIRAARGARPLCVQVQDGAPCVWMLLDAAREQCKHLFRIYGTGWDMDDTVRMEQYVGTFQVDGGMLIWHLFYVGEVMTEVVVLDGEQREEGVV